jgi:hypothetical protein
MIKIILASLFLLLGCEDGSLMSNSQTELIEIKIEYWGKTFVNIKRPNIEGVEIYEQGRDKGEIFFNYQKGSIYKVRMQTNGDAYFKIFENGKMVFHDECISQGCEYIHMGVAGE